MAQITVMGNEGSEPTSLEPLETAWRGGFNLTTVPPLPDLELEGSSPGVPHTAHPSPAPIYDLLRINPEFRTDFDTEAAEPPSCRATPASPDQLRVGQLYRLLSCEDVFVRVLPGPVYNGLYRCSTHDMYGRNLGPGGGVDPLFEDLEGMYVRAQDVELIA